MLVVYVNHEVIKTARQRKCHQVDALKKSYHNFSHKIEFIHKTYNSITIGLNVVSNQKILSQVYSHILDNYALNTRLSIEFE